MKASARFGWLLVLIATANALIVTGVATAQLDLDSGRAQPPEFGLEMVEAQIGALEKICSLSEDQLEEIRRLARAALDQPSSPLDSVHLYAEPQGLDGVLMDQIALDFDFSSPVAVIDGHPPSRKPLLLEEPPLREQIESILDKTQRRARQAWRDESSRFRRRAIASTLLAEIDARLLLSDEQRSAFLEPLERAIGVSANEQIEWVAPLVGISPYFGNVPRENSVLLLEGPAPAALLLLDDSLMSQALDTARLELWSQTRRSSLALWFNRLSDIDGSFEIRQDEKRTAIYFRPSTGESPSPSSPVPLSQFLLGTMIQDVRETCDLGDSQVTKLRVAIKGAMEAIQPTDSNDLRMNVANERLNREQEDLFESKVTEARPSDVFYLRVPMQDQEPDIRRSPFWIKALRGILSKPQLEAYRQMQARRSAFRHRALAQRLVARLDRIAYLRPEQRDALVDVLEKKLALERNDRIEAVCRQLDLTFQPSRDEFVLAVVLLVRHSEAARILDENQMQLWDAFENLVYRGTHYRFALDGAELAIRQQGSFLDVRFAPIGENR